MAELIDGRISLTTPEGVRLLLTPAGPAVRAWAWALDFVIWAGVASVAAAILSTTRFGNGVAMVVGFLAYWGYPVVCEVYFGGQTIGKRAADIEVVRADGLPVGWRESVLRNLLLVADFLPAAYATGLVCMLSDVQFRRLGDIVAATMVVYREKPRPRPATASVAPIAPPFPLTPEQQRPQTDLFEREARLPPARVIELASLAEALTGTTGEESLARLRGMAAGLGQ